MYPQGAGSKILKIPKMSLGNSNSSSTSTLNNIFKSDCWSLGICFYRILYRTFPSKHQQHSRTAVLFSIQDQQRQIRFGGVGEILECWDSYGDGFRIVEFEDCEEVIEENLNQSQLQLEHNNSANNIENDDDEDHQQNTALLVKTQTSRTIKKQIVNPNPILDQTSIVRLTRLIRLTKQLLRTDLKTRTSASQARKALQSGIMRMELMEGGTNNVVESESQSEARAAVATGEENEETIDQEVKERLLHSTSDLLSASLQSSRLIFTAPELDAGDFLIGNDDKEEEENEEDPLLGGPQEKKSKDGKLKLKLVKKKSKDRLLEDELSSTKLNARASLNNKQNDNRLGESRRSTNRVYQNRLHKLLFTLIITTVLVCLLIFAFQKIQYNDSVRREIPTTRHPFPKTPPSSIPTPEFLRKIPERDFYRKLLSILPAYRPHEAREIPLAFRTTSDQQMRTGLRALTKIIFDRGLVNEYLESIQREGGNSNSDPWYLSNLAAKILIHFVGGGESLMLRTKRNSISNIDLQLLPLRVSTLKEWFSIRRSLQKAIDTTKETITISSETNPTINPSTSTSSSDDYEYFIELHRGLIWLFKGFLDDPRGGGYHSRDRFLYV